MKIVSTFKIQSYCQTPKSFGRASNLASLDGCFRHSLKFSKVKSSFIMNIFKK